ncbi:MAG: 16S rRNA processing protein RimM [Calditrichaeota bacterium]|nr:16S rRNA processing protein RimM [Calditrichota bacterium]
MTAPVAKPSDEDEWVEIGVVARPHGLRGELKVAGVDAEMARFRKVGEVRLETGDVPVQGAVKSFRANGRVVLLRVAGIETREAAEALRGATVLVRKSELPQLDEGAYYAFELVGCEVFSAAGERVGPVVEVQDFPANDVLVVREGRREVLVPLVEPVIAKIDTEARRIVLKDIEGLLE